MNTKKILWLLVWVLLEGACAGVMGLYGNDGWQTNVICALAVGLTIYTGASGKLDLQI